MEEIELAKANYLAKPLEELKSRQPLLFNGSVIQRIDDTLHLTQERQCKKITLIKMDLNLKSSYIQQRARGAYIASTCQPETAFALSFAAQITQPTIKDAEYLNKQL